MLEVETRDPAALSESVWAVLNPLLGFTAIKRLGNTYWHAAAIVFGATLLTSLIGLVLGSVPILGTFAMAFIGTYSSLAIGALLGFAVFKRAREIGWH